MKNGRMLTLSVSPPPKFCELVPRGLGRLGALAFLPQFSAGYARALHQRFEFRPHDGGRRALDELGLCESAVCAGDNILAAHQAREPKDSVSHQPWMFDGDGVMSDDTRN